MEITRNNLLSLIKDGMERHSLNITALEREARVPKDTIRDFLRGKTQILRADKLQKVVEVLQPTRKVAITGVVGIGGEIIPEPRDKKTLEVDCPPGVEPGEVRAVRIHGDMLTPVLHDGWIIYYTANRDSLVPIIPGGWQVPYARTAKKQAAPSRKSAKPSAPTHAMLSAFFGKPCVIHLKDGRIFLRTLKPGSKEKKYHLISYMAPDIKDVEVEWVAKIIFIKTE